MSDKEPDNEKSELEKKAELLMELRGYQKEKLHKDEESIDIEATKSDSDESVLIRIVTKSDLKSNGVGVDKAGEVKQMVDEQDFDKVIVFGRRFSKAAKENLNEIDVEFFSQDKKIISSFNPQTLYLKIHDIMDSLCQIKCGYIPQSESECEGYSKDPIKCYYCEGSGKYMGSYRQHRCPICGGTGSRENHYSCKVRLISDNADFHLKHSWTNLLQNDLLSLLTIIRTTKLENDDDSLI